MLAWSVHYELSSFYRNDNLSDWVNPFFEEYMFDDKFREFFSCSCNLTTSNHFFNNRYVTYFFSSLNSCGDYGFSKRLMLR